MSVGGIGLPQSIGKGASRLYKKPYHPYCERGDTILVANCDISANSKVRVCETAARNRVQ